MYVIKCFASSFYFLKNLIGKSTKLQQTIISSKWFIGSRNMFNYYIANTFLSTDYMHRYIYPLNYKTVYQLPEKLDDSTFNNIQPNTNAFDIYD